MYLSAGGTDVFGSLLELELLDDPSDGRTVAGSVLPCDAGLLGPFRHKL